MKKSTKMILLSIVLICSFFYFNNGRITNIREGAENQCSDNQKNIASRNNSRLKALLTSYDSMDFNLKRINNNISINKSNIESNEKDLKKLGDRAKEQEEKNKYGKSE